MGQIEWAMWANEQALASGLSEWGAAALGAGLQRAAVPGVRGAAAVQAGARAGEVGAWRPQAMAEERGRGQAGEGAGEGPEEPETLGCRPGSGN